MFYQIKVCEFKNLTPNQRFQLSKLSRRTYWLSQRFTSLCKGRTPKFTKIIYAVNKGQVLGWVLLWNDGYFRDLMVYVNRSFRGQGIGS